METITVTLNGKEVSGSVGMSILNLARETGVDIPTLCEDPQLTLTGACRICLVEDERNGALVASCVTPIAPGMVINTHSPKVLQTRRVIVELLMASHCGSCFMCEKANTCGLREIAADLEVGFPRFEINRRYYPMEDISPYIHRDLTKCILCRRCVKACTEIAKQNVFSIGYRGFDSKIIVDFDQPLSKDVCRDCGICIPYCPTGALTKPRELGGEKTGKPLVISHRLPSRED